MPAEHIAPRQHVLLLDFNWHDRRDEPFTPTYLDIERCSVIPDTPGNRAELARGAALNDQLRGPELDHFPLH